MCYVKPGGYVQTALPSKLVLKASLHLPDLATYRASELFLNQTRDSASSIHTLRVLVGSTLMQD
jgi:hypothetical protein